jgi:2-polyprenyl-3-methyl-5-hydroxy-6-metoxy-1,4-benzoquinol methylase
MEPTERAFQEYGRRSHQLDGPPDEKQRWFDSLMRSTYLPYLGSPAESRILEIGCNRGYLLRALQNAGFKRLTGLDLSPDDLEEARRRTGLDDLHHADATAFLRDHPRAYDTVVFKAVLEHVPRDGTRDFLEAVVRGLADGGTVLCEVPNMDWYAASHERFMDLTHETGYTPESLRQLFELYFAEVEIRKVVDPSHGILASPLRRFLRRAAFGAARRLLSWLGEDAATFWFDCRSILAVARRSRQREAGDSVD